MKGRRARVCVRRECLRPSKVRDRQEQKTVVPVPTSGVTSPLGAPGTRSEVVDPFGLGVAKRFLVPFLCKMDLPTRGSATGTLGEVALSVAE